jgi:hypothetical protein
MARRTRRSSALALLRIFDKRSRGRKDRGSCFNTGVLQIIQLVHCLSFVRLPSCNKPSMASCARRYEGVARLLRRPRSLVLCANSGTQMQLWQAAVARMEMIDRATEKARKLESGRPETVIAGNEKNRGGGQPLAGSASQPWLAGVIMAMAWLTVSWRE